MKNYFLPETDKNFEVIKQLYSEFLNQCLDIKLKNLGIQVGYDLVEAGDTGMLNEIILVAEHNRDWFESLLFAIDFDIAKPGSTENFSLSEMFDSRAIL